MGRTHRLNGIKSRNIKENAITIMEEERKKANKLIKGLRRDMVTQSKRISSNNVTAENRRRAREEFLFLKSSLNKIGNEKLEKAKDSPSLIPK